MPTMRGRGAKSQVLLGGFFLVLCAVGSAPRAGAALLACPACPTACPCGGGGGGGCTLSSGDNFVIRQLPFSYSTQPGVNPCSDSLYNVIVRALPYNGGGVSIDSIESQVNHAVGVCAPCIPCNSCPPPPPPPPPPAPGTISCTPYTSGPCAGCCGGPNSGCASTWTGGSCPGGNWVLTGSTACGATSYVCVLPPPQSSCISGALIGNQQCTLYTSGPCVGSCGPGPGCPSTWTSWGNTSGPGTVMYSVAGGPTNINYYCP